MRTSIYLKLQKKFGGQWIATSKKGHRVYAKGTRVEDLFTALKKKGVPPEKTAIGHIEKYGQLSAYLSVSIQTD